MARDVLQELLDSLSLERIEKNLFRGPSQDLGWGRVFGGQVLGQALSAARQTVPDDRPVHSVHAYFLRVGDVDRPVVYTVDCIRDGRSFTTRRVVAIQHGRPIFNLSASFQIVEQGLSHHDEAPDAPDPESLKSETELSQRYLARLPEAILNKIPLLLRERAYAERPIEIRPVSPLDPIRPAPRPPNRQVWFRAARKLPDDLAIHQYLLAYASDFHFLATSMQPHAVSWMTPGIQSASLDHAMWFHRPFRMDRWLLYDIHSPSSGGSRGLVHGRFFQDGVLVASAMQEGLVRDLRKDDDGEK
ncbi:MAG: acyl-CoA thioesterase-2 [Myxococcota bacterium]|jgi:acyl-CoA thioesterase-2